MAFFNRRYHPIGTPPGTLTARRPDRAEPLRIRLVDYDRENFKVVEDIAARDCQPYLDHESITWIHVQGHPDEEVLRELGESFSLHPLALEDILNAGERPKLETFPDQFFMVLSLPYVAGGVATTTQISIFFTKRFLVSFCEQDIGRFDPVVTRLSRPDSRLRQNGVDFLLYSLIDIVVDQGFPVLEQLGQRLDDLEIEILETAKRDTLETIHRVKRELVVLRSMLWPHREVINRLLQDDDQFIATGTHLFFRDCYDHAIQIMELLETYRDMASSMLEIYLSSINNRMNDIMRVLTIIATIFIPLTFITGIYGMNFDRSAGPTNMPELGMPYGYLGIWLLMIAVAALMVAYFKRKNWF